MAAISSISNGEALSSVRTKLNNVITEINLLDPTDWVDYSATSTIVGWSSRTTTVIKYRVIGRQVFVNFYIEGISNSTSTTFTLPYTALYSSIGYLRLTNNGVISEAFFRVIDNSSIVTSFTTVVSSTWTASGTKQISGQFFYEIA